MKNASKRWIKADERKLIKMLKDGYPVAAVCHALGRTRSSVLTRKALLTKGKDLPGFTKKQTLPIEFDTAPEMPNTELPEVNLELYELRAEHKVLQVSRDFREEVAPSFMTNATQASSVEIKVLERGASGTQREISRSFENVADVKYNGDWVTIKYARHDKIFEETFRNVVRVIHAAGDAGELFDGYHTFNELYEFRLVYNAALFNEWWNERIYNVHKSLRHHGGNEPCFGGGWFVVSADLPTGQITNHYPVKYWNMFKCEERKNAVKWDGHSSSDVRDRLEKFIITNY